MIKLSELNEKQKSDYMAYYEKMKRGEIGEIKVLEPNLVCDSYGLFFPHDYLERIGTNVILFPLEIASNYRDAVTEQMMKENSSKLKIDVLKEVGSYSPEFVLDNANATAIGNLCYICLNHPDLQCRQVVEDFLTKMQDIRLAQVAKLLKSQGQA